VDRFSPAVQEAMSMAVGLVDCPGSKVTKVRKNPRCLEYIVVHEMTHLRERGRGDHFIALMDQYLPNWRTLRDELNAAPSPMSGGRRTDGRRSFRPARRVGLIMKWEEGIHGRL